MDGDRAERAKALCMSRAGYIGTLTTIHREVEALMNSNGKLADVYKKLASYDRSLRDFVNTHEKYLNVLNHEFERQAAYDVYEGHFLILQSEVNNQIQALDCQLYQRRKKC